MILSPDEPVGARASDALLALDADPRAGYPWNLCTTCLRAPCECCPGCGAGDPANCACRPGGARPDLDDLDLEEIGRVF